MNWSPQSVPPAALTEVWVNVVSGITKNDPSNTNKLKNVIARLVIGSSLLYFAQLT